MRCIHEIERDYGKLKIRSGVRSRLGDRDNDLRECTTAFRLAGAPQPIPPRCASHIPRTWRSQDQDSAPLVVYGRSCFDGDLVSLRSANTPSGGYVYNGYLISCMSAGILGMSHDRTPPCKPALSRRPEKCSSLHRTKKKTTPLRFSKIICSNQACKKQKAHSKKARFLFCFDHS